MAKNRTAALVEDKQDDVQVQDQDIANGEQSTAEPPVQEPQVDMRDEKVVLALGADKLIAIWGNKSNAIRGLNALGHKCGPISRALNIRFQHARNVLSKPLKRAIAEERKAAAAKAE